MFIRLTQSDRALCRQALVLYLKAVETAAKATALVSVPTMALDIAQGHAERVAADIQRLGPTERGIDIDGAHLRQALRAALTVMATKLEKTKDAELDLGLGDSAEDTLARIKQVTTIDARVSGQTSWVDDEDDDSDRQGLDDSTTVTFESGGKQVSMSGSEFSRAAKNAVAEGH